MKTCVIPDMLASATMMSENHHSEESNGRCLASLDIIRNMFYGVWKLVGATGVDFVKFEK